MANDSISCIFVQDGISFHKTRDNLLPRPWCVDHLDALLDRLASKRYRRAVLFVDNSGADIILGDLQVYNAYHQLA